MLMRCLATGCSTASNLPNFNGAKLPNPFLFNNGRPVRTRADWDCRREQIHALVQGYEAGALPGKPPIFVSTFSRDGLAGNLTITAGLSRSQTISFSSSITFPSGNPPRAGWPLIIGYAGGSIPIPDGVSFTMFMLLVSIPYEH
jgi:hypothetical protein